MDITKQKNEYWLSREEQLIGGVALEVLRSSTVAVFGLGGVGGACCEALVRGGIGSLVIIDNDNISSTNLNRQIFATVDTVGMPKTEAAAKRLLSINPNLNIVSHSSFFDECTTEKIDFDKIDFICDCIDSTGSKVLLAKIAQEKNIKIISSMGTGNKLNPSLFKVADISKTAYCPLARVMRKRLKDAGVRKLTVVYSEEEPVKNTSGVPASIAFVPPAAGLIMAGHVINRLIENAIAEGTASEDAE